MTIHEIRRQHVGYFFHPDNMRAFRSRILKHVYHGVDGEYFVTSEQLKKDGPRQYTVRKYDVARDTISTIGPHHTLSKAQAIQLAKRVMTMKPEDIAAIKRVWP